MGHMPAPGPTLAAIQDTYDFRPADAGDTGKLRGHERKVEAMTAPTLPLNDGNGIPQIGLGTWPLDDAEVARVVVAAIEAGYRHIDTAYRYGNERGVGQGIRDSGIRREDVFVTTELDGA